MTQDKNGKRQPTVGVVGIGIMGFAYARNLLEAGFTVVGFDPAEERMGEFTGAGGQGAKSPRAVAEAAEVVLMALPSVAALESAALGEDGVAQASRKGLVVAEMSTLPLAAKEAARKGIEARGATVLDCPVSGTGAQAARRDLVVFASGDAKGYAALQPVFEALGRDIRHVGPFGDGMKLKYIANLLVTIHNLAAAEALVVAQKAGLDLGTVFDAIAAGAGSSRMFEVRGPMMVEGRYEPPTMRMDLYMKDIQLILDFAKEVKAPTPLMAASLPYYVAGLAEGRDGEDTAALFGVLQNMAGVGKGKRGG